MKKKLILLMLLLLTLTGCSAVYNLEIKDDKINEKIQINPSINNNKELSYFKNNDFYAIMDGASNFQEYKKQIKNNRINLVHTYDISDYNKATVLSSCFKAYNVIEEKKYYVISTSNGVTCATEEDTILLNDLRIILKSNHIVKDTNAKKVNRYTYEWRFNKNNYKNGKIYIKLYKDKYVFNYDNIILKRMGLFVGAPALIASIIYLIYISVKLKKRKVNKV